MKRIIWVLFALSMMAGCKQIEYVPVIEQHTDTTYITKWERDSVWLHDSVTIKEKGDSFFVERWHTKYVEKIKVDTLYQHKTDSVPVPYEVEKKLSAWESVKVSYGGYAILIVAATAVVVILRLKRKFLP